MKVMRVIMAAALFVCVTVAHAEPARKLASVVVGLDDAEQLRGIINEQFYISKNKKSVYLKEVQCNTKVRKDGYADYVCTLLRSKYDGAIFSGSDASRIVNILLKAGVDQEHSGSRFEISVKGLHCRVTGYYDDGTFEHTCSARGVTSSIPVASN